MSERKTNQQKSSALENVKSEIDNNKGRPNRDIEKLYTLLDLTKFLRKNIAHDENLMTSPQVLRAFIRTHFTRMEFRDFPDISTNLYQYKGKINLNTALSNIGITNITRLTLQNSGIDTSFNFDFLM